MLERGGILIVYAAVARLFPYEHLPPSGHSRSLTGHKFFLLCLFLLAILIFYPYVQNGGFGYLHSASSAAPEFWWLCTPSACEERSCL